MSEAYIKTIKMAEGYKSLMQMQRISWRLEVKRLMSDPKVPNDIKEAIQEAKDTVVLEKLLSDAGLLF